MSIIGKHGVSPSTRCEAALAFIPKREEREKGLTRLAWTSTHASQICRLAVDVPRSHDSQFTVEIIAAIKDPRYSTSARRQI
jgi:hypothetical protein